MVGKYGRMFREQRRGGIFKPQEVVVDRAMRDSMRIKRGSTEKRVKRYETVLKLCKYAVPS